MTLEIPIMDKNLEELAEAAFLKYEKCQVFAVSMPEKYGFIGGYMAACIELGAPENLDKSKAYDGLDKLVGM